MTLDDKASTLTKLVIDTLPSGKVECECKGQCACFTWTPTGSEKSVESRIMLNQLKASTKNELLDLAITVAATLQGQVG